MGGAASAVRRLTRRFTNKVHPEGPCPKQDTAEGRKREAPEEHSSNSSRDLNKSGLHELRPRESEEGPGPGPPGPGPAEPWADRRNVQSRSRGRSRGSGGSGADAKTADAAPEPSPARRQSPPEPESTKAEVMEAEEAEAAESEPADPVLPATRPQSEDGVCHDEAGQPVPKAEIAIPPDKPQSLPPPWVRVPYEDDSYYWNTETDEVTWDFPVVAESVHGERLCHTQDLPGVDQESDESEEEDLMAVLSSCREAKAWGVLESLGSKQEDQGVLKKELSPSAPSQAAGPAATCTRQSLDEHLPSREALDLDRDEASGTCADGAALAELETERGPAPGKLEDVPAHRDGPTGSPSSRFAETSPISALVLRAGCLSTHGSRASQFYDLVKLRRSTDSAEGANGFFETYRVLRKRGRDAQASTTALSWQDKAWHPAQEGLEGPEKVRTEDDSAREDVVMANQPEGSSPSGPTASRQKCNNDVFARRKRTMQPPNKQRSVARITAKRPVATPARASADAALVAAYTSSGSCGKSSTGPARQRPKWQ